jgi:hypothetical protein
MTVPFRVCWLSPVACRCVLVLRSCCLFPDWEQGVEAQQGQRLLSEGLTFGSLLPQVGHHDPRYQLTVAAGLPSIRPWTLPCCEPSLVSRRLPGDFRVACSLDVFTGVYTGVYTGVLRRVRDSNPGSPRGSLVFKTSALNRSANPPGPCCPLLLSLVLILVAACFLSLLASCCCLFLVAAFFCCSCIYCQVPNFRFQQLLL